MGSRPSYTIEDYATRIELYLHTHSPAHTERILRDVKGTDFRLVEGLLFLAMNKRVRVDVTKHKMMWELRG